MGFFSRQAALLLTGFCSVVQIPYYILKIQIRRREEIRAMIPKDLLGLRKLYLGFTGARVLLTANNLGIFEHLKKPCSASKLSGLLGTDLRATEIVLDALSGIGLAKKSRNGKYLNTQVTRRYLIRSSPRYQGDIIRHASSMWENFSLLDTVLRTGHPSRESSRTHDQHEAFIMGMHNLSLLRAGALARAIGLKRVKTMLDLGGGPGTHAIEMAKKGIKATIFDLPDTIVIARKVARREKVRGIRFIAGDFQIDDIGSGYDLILVSQIVHAFSEEENRALLHKCREALRPGGRVAVHEFPIDESRTSPVHSALFSVNMLVSTEHGRCYAPREMKEWLWDTGFHDVVEKQLPETVLLLGSIRKSVI